ncbi:MAG: putative PEP-binding protein [Thermosynechococcaceae cyanobacterium]
MTQPTDTREGLYSLYRLGQDAVPSKIGMQAAQLSRFSTAISTAILPVDALQLFLERVEWSLPLLRDFPHLKLHLNLEQPDQLQAIAQAIQTSIAETLIPHAWTQAWINDLQNWGMGGEKFPLCLTPSLWLPTECEISVTGLTQLMTPQVCWLQSASLADGVKQLWQQLFQAQILYLWEQSGFPFEQLRLAVVLQPLLPMSASGWLWLTPAQLFVQAMPEVYCEQEASMPDQFQVNRDTGNVMTRKGRYSDRLSERCSGDIMIQQAWVPEPALALTNLNLATLAGFANQLPMVVEELLYFRWCLAEDSGVQICEVASDSPFPWFNLIEQVPDTEALTLGRPATPGRAIASALVTPDLQSHPPEAVAHQIIVVRYCQPSDLPWLRQAAGLICETGGLTSHGAILARELGLPAILGFAGAMTAIKTGQPLRLEGEQGAVYRVDDEPQQQIRSKIIAVPSDSQLLKTQVWVTLSQFQEAELISQLPVDGVGLLRSEWLLLDLLQRHHPQQWIEQNKQADLVQKLIHSLQNILKAFAPRPVFYRTFDGSTRELAGLEGGNIEPFEVNPALGLRGVARYQSDPRLFDCELAALAELQRQGWDNLRLLLPFVRSVEEFAWCCDRISTAGLFNSPHFEVWMMAEVPSVLFLLEDYVKAGVQGIAIGSNDLTQLMLGVDRDQPLLDDSLNVSHPAVMAAISQLIQSAQTFGIPCSLCGQIPIEHPQLMAKLVDLGITAISVDRQAVFQVRRTIARLETAP